MMKRVKNKIMLDMVNIKRVDIKEETTLTLTQIVSPKVTINMVVIINQNSEVPAKLIGEENKEKPVGYKKESMKLLIKSNLHLWIVLEVWKVLKLSKVLEIN